LTEKVLVFDLSNPRNLQATAGPVTVTYVGKRIWKGMDNLWGGGMMRRRGRGKELRLASYDQPR
jgi:hypothetical protein